MDSPLARPLTKFSTLSVERLNAVTVYPLLAMFKTRFSPITARPIKPISDRVFIEFQFIFCKEIVTNGATILPAIACVICQFEHDPSL